MIYRYTPKGVCIAEISFDIDKNAIVSNISFLGGCDGNLKVLSKVFDGKSVSEIIKVGRYNTCDGKPTSCMDQFAIAVEAAAKENGIEY